LKPKSARGDYGRNRLADNLLVFLISRRTAAASG
jgi:hypothetical protein